MNKKLLCVIGTVLVSAMLLLSVLTVAVGHASSMDSDDEEDDGESDEEGETDEGDDDEEEDDGESDDDGDEDD
ncbi:MAG: hypothetical protein ACOCTR_04295, partial [Candidatus Natronoplasma sp.]